MKTIPLWQPTWRDKPNDFSVSETLKHHNLKRLERVQKLSRWMDNFFRIPGTPIRFGLDSLIGVIPGVGDSITAVASGWILHEAYQSGVPKRTLAKMAGNIAVDLCVGALPIVGDLFDVYWKSNIRNVRLLAAHLDEHTHVTPKGEIK